MNEITDQGNPNNPFRSADKAVVEKFASMLSWLTGKEFDECALASMWGYSARRAFDKDSYTAVPYSIYNRCVSSTDAAAIALQTASQEGVSSASNPDSLSASAAARNTLFEITASSSDGSSLLISIDITPFLGMSVTSNGTTAV